MDVNCKKSWDIGAFLFYIKFNDKIIYIPAKMQLKFSLLPNDRNIVPNENWTFPEQLEHRTASVLLFVCLARLDNFFS